MNTYSVYVEDTKGNCLDEYTIEANSEDHAYDLVYERHNWASIYVCIDEVVQNDK
jgi:hypothetical protein